MIDRLNRNEGPHVWVRFEPDSEHGMFVCGDENGEFARAVNEATILTYVSDLLYGPGTIREGGLRDARVKTP